MTHIRRFLDFLFPPSPMLTDSERAFLREWSRYSTCPIAGQVMLRMAETGRPE